MTTKRENILDQIKTSLANTTNVGTRIYRSRVVPLARNESPALVIEPVSDTCEQNLSLPKLDWSLTVRISIIVRASTSDDVPDSVADPIVESVHSKMTADLTLNSTCIDVQPQSVSFEMVDADQPAGVIGMDFLIRYRTNVNSVTA